MVHFSRLLVCAALCAAAVAVPSAAADTRTVTVFAAASLKNALDEAAAAYQAKTGDRVTISYAASSALAKQIENGAPADVFASADARWMRYLEERSLLQASTRMDLLGNTLVVVAPTSSPVEKLDLTPEAFDRAVGDGKWTTGLVTSVPIGVYAKEALTRLGIWSVAEPKLAQADNVRAALSFVSRNEAVLGIVYQTDANADPKVKVVATFPAGTHEPIVYPFALTSTAESGSPGRFLAFLTSPEAKLVFKKQGFRVLED
jgi:molybdate transport system substrate-binding protein